MCVFFAAVVVPPELQLVQTELEVGGNGVVVHRRELNGGLVGDGGLHLLRLLLRCRIVLGQDVLLDGAHHGVGLLRRLRRRRYQLQLRQRLQKRGLGLTQLIGSADELRQLLLGHRQLLLGGLLLAFQTLDLLSRLGLGAG